MKLKSFITVLILLFAIVLICTGCSSNNLENDKNIENFQVESKEIKKDIPEGEFSDMGEGTFILSTISGTSENGNIPVFFVDDNELAGKMYEMQMDVGISTRGFDGTKITNIYVDGYLQGKEQLADTDTSQAVSEKLTTVGIHKVELLQFDDNNNVVTYKSAEYEIKTK